MPWSIRSIYKHPKDGSYLFQVYHNDFFGLANEDGELVIPAEFILLDEYRKGDDSYLLGVKSLADDFNIYPDGKNNIVFDYDGKIAFFIENEGLQVLSKDKFAVKNKEGKWGVYDLNKNLLIDHLYKNLYPLGSQLFYAQFSSGIWGIIDYDNNIIHTFDFIDSRNNEFKCSFLLNKLIKLKNKSDKYALMSSSGEFLTDFKYDKIRPLIHLGYCCVEINKLQGLLDANGREILPLIYDNLELLNDSIVLGTKGKNHFLINIKDTSLKNNSPFEIIVKAWMFSNDEILLVKNNGLYGYIDLNGNIIIHCQFTEARPFENSYTSVKIGDKCFIINKLGERIFEY
jgi:hypothetical protein